MFKKHHTTALNFLLIIGIIIYLFFVFNHNLPTATISLILFLYAWIIGRAYYKTFDIHELLNKTGCIGVLFSITYFFMFGIEEVPYPEGAIFFHSQAIALSLIVFIVSHIIILYSQNRLNENSPDFFESLEPETENAESANELRDKIFKDIVGEQEEWEEATLEDLESGNYEPA